MDYRYETSEEKRDFHKKRRAFIIYNEKIEFLPKESVMSHYEYCSSKGLAKDVFNQIIRGYYLDEKVVFYKDNFIFDKELITDALKYLDDISLILKVDEFLIYFGVLTEQDFKLDFYYGKYCKGKVIRDMQKV